MGGEFWLALSEDNQVTEYTWTAALRDIVRKFAWYGDEDHVFERQGAEYAFMYIDPNYPEKNFGLKWEWVPGGGAIESNLNGRRRTDWRLVVQVCKFLCDQFPGQMALVVSDGFSGCNDDVGSMFYDGTPPKPTVLSLIGQWPAGWHRVDYKEWPWTGDAPGPSKIVPATASCLRVCSLCCSTTPPPGGFLRCGACKSRLYCNKGCQLQDWKKGGHKKACGKPAERGASHAVECPYSHRNPNVTEENLVETGTIKMVKGKHCQLVTTGLNTCIFVVVKTSVGIIGWHATSQSSLRSSISAVRRTFEEQVSLKNFVCGFVIPGVDRDENLDLKPDCRTMRVMSPDPTESKLFILGVLEDFWWANRLEVSAIRRGGLWLIMAFVGGHFNVTVSHRSVLSRSCFRVGASRWHAQRARGKRGERVAGRPTPEAVASEKWK